MGEMIERRTDDLRGGSRRVSTLDLVGALVTSPSNAFQALKEIGKAHV